jgi:hypothetical protein
MKEDQSIRKEDFTLIKKYLNKNDQSELSLTNKKINSFTQETQATKTPLSSSQGIIHNILKTLKEDGLFEELLHPYLERSTMAPEWSTLKTPKEKIQRICSFLTNRILKSDDKTEFNEFLEHNGIVRLMTLLDYKFCDIDVDNTKVFPSNSISPDAKDPTNTVAGNRVGDRALTPEEKEKLINDIFTALYSRLKSDDKEWINDNILAVNAYNKSTKDTLKPDLNLIQATTILDDIIKKEKDDDDIIGSPKKNTRDSKIIATNLFIYYCNSHAIDDDDKITALLNNNVLTYLLQNQPKIFIGLFNKLHQTYLRTKFELFTKIINSKILISDLANYGQKILVELFNNLPLEFKAKVIDSNYTGKFLTKYKEAFFEAELGKLNPKDRVQFLTSDVGVDLATHNERFFTKQFVDLTEESRVEVLMGLNNLETATFFHLSKEIKEDKNKAKTLNSRAGKVVMYDNPHVITMLFEDLSEESKVVFVSSIAGKFLVTYVNELFLVLFGELDSKGKAEVLVGDAGRSLLQIAPWQFIEILGELDSKYKAEVLAGYVGRFSEAQITELLTEPTNQTDLPKTNFQTYAYINSENKNTNSIISNLSSDIDKDNPKSFIDNSGKGK